MLIGVSSYSFAAYVRKGEMQEDEIPALAKKLGFEMLEFAGLKVPEGQNILDYAEHIKKKVAEAGLEMGTYAIGADLIYGSNGDIAAEVERLKGEVDVAERLGAKLMRHDVAHGIKADDRAGRGFADVAPAMADAIREVTEYAATKGIKTMTENHGFFSQDSDRIEHLVNLVGSENFGVLLDMGNFLCVDEDPQIATSRLAPYSFHVHAKDFLWKSGDGITPEGFFGTRGGNYLRGTVIGQGVVPITAVLRALKAVDYKGDLSIEFEGWEDPVQALTAGLVNLKRALAAAGIERD